jgi:hypothetical protein
MDGIDIAITVAIIGAVVLGTYFEVVKLGAWQQKKEIEHQKKLKQQELDLQLQYQREQMRMMRDEVPGALPPRSGQSIAPPPAARPSPFSPGYALRQGAPSSPPDPPAGPAAQPSGRLNADRL